MVVYRVCFRENDQCIGLADEQDLPTPQLTTHEQKENDLIHQLFINVAGADGEVDWKELKDILDYYTNKEEPAVNSSNAAPPDNNLLLLIISLLCGLLCKKEQASDYVPNIKPTPPETRAQGFSKDTCRSMISMLDTDKNGRLNFEEFKRLWTSIRTWKAVFLKYDKNQSGSLTGFELREALGSAGYSLNNRILNILMHRYGNKRNEIDFDDFIMCAVKLKVIIEIFKLRADSGATIKIDDWIEGSLHAYM